MKKQKINIVAYSEKDSDQWFSCDKKEFEQIISANASLEKENEVLRMALRNSVIDADFYKYGSQSTTDENIKRILRLEEQYIQQAKEQRDK